MKKRLLIALVVLLALAATASLVWANSGGFVESVQVPGVGWPVSSTTSLTLGETYCLRASGTYVYWPGQLPNYGIADAEYSLRPPGSWDWGTKYGQWVFGDDVFPPSYPASALDVRVDGQNVYWGGFNTDHTYALLYVGTGSPATFNIWDSNVGPPYADNSGYITVDIYEVGCLAEWLPPITNADFALQNGTTLPIKFRLCSPGDFSADITVTITGPGLDSSTFTPLYDPVEDYYIVNFHTKDYTGLVDGSQYTATVFRNGCQLGSYSFYLYAKAGRGNSGK